MSANPAQPPLTPPQTPKSEHGVRPTTLYLVSGKKNNKAFRSALALYRENATIQEDLPQTHDDKENPQCNIEKEEGYYAHGVKH